MEDSASEIFLARVAKWIILFYALDVLRKIKLKVHEARIKHCCIVAVSFAEIV
jgi:hypothetical protein